MLNLKIYMIVCVVSGMGAIFSDAKTKQKEHLLLDILALVWIVYTAVKVFN